MCHMHPFIGVFDIIFAISNRRFYVVTAISGCVMGYVIILCVNCVLKRGNGTGKVK